MHEVTNKFGMECNVLRKFNKIMILGRQVDELTSSLSFSRQANKAMAF